MFGKNTFGRSGGTSMFGGSAAPDIREMEVPSPPEDTVQCVKFSPATTQSSFLVAGSWDGKVRCWEVEQNGQSVPKAEQSHEGPVLSLCWSDDGARVFTASCDKSAKMWDLGSNQFVQIAQHEAPVRTVHWIKAPNYQCVMTSSWDKTVKLWDTRSPDPMLTFHLPDRAYCADVVYPMAIVATADRNCVVYQLENTPQEYRRFDSTLKYQSRSVAIFSDKKTNAPTGFALGSIEGRVAIQHVNPARIKDNFTFKCHRDTTQAATNSQDIYAVNGITFNSVYGTMATVGSDGRFCYWDKDEKTKTKMSDKYDQAITCCDFDAKGRIFAFAVGYDWSKGHAAYDPSKKPRILLRYCLDEIKPQGKK